MIFLEDWNENTTEDKAFDQFLYEKRTKIFLKEKSKNHKELISCCWERI